MQISRQAKFVYRSPNSVKKIKLKYNLSMDTISHIGIARNELADTLAGMANQKPYIDLEINLELQEAYSPVDKLILDLWQQKWNTCTNESLYWQLTPKGIINIKLNIYL